MALIIALVAAFLVLVAVGATVVFWPSDTDTAGKIRNGKPPFNPNMPVNSQSLGSIDPNALFWEMFFRQAQQPILRTRGEFFSRAEKESSRNLYSVSDEAFDYRTNQYRSTHVGHWRGESKIRWRCVDSLQYSRNAYNTGWSPDPPEFNKSCAGSKFSLGDGIIPAGLTPDQTHTMINTMTLEYPGFIRAQRPELVDVRGKQYLRLPVTATPVIVDGESWGMQILTWAFKDTGLDYAEHPYIPAGGPSQGANLVYYVDPETLLPSFVHRQGTPSLAANGTPKQGQQVTASRTEYVRPAVIPADPLADETPWLLSWDVSVR